MPRKEFEEGYERVEVELYTYAVTRGAVIVSKEREASTKDRIFLPKKLVVFEPQPRGYPVKMQVPRWLAEQEGLI